MEKQFAAFIMTYERARILPETITRIKQQTLSPAKILVVDNSNSFETRDLINGLNDPAIVYHRIGYNSGPAGAAKIGLSILTSEGYQWIYWGDDDNPPMHEGIFEKLIAMGNDLLNSGVKVAAIGITGSKLSRMGRLLRVDGHLSPVANEVHMIHGSNKLIVHRDIVSQGVLPDERLFFGFEEMDFCLRARDAGFKLFFHGALQREMRTKFNRDIRKSIVAKENSYQLRRRYFSYRNLIVIYWGKRKKSIWTLSLIAGWLINSFRCLRFGFRYFVIRLKIILLAVRDGFSGKMDRTELLNKYHEETA